MPTKLETDTYTHPRPLTPDEEMDFALRLAKLGASPDLVKYVGGRQALVKAGMADVHLGGNAFLNVLRALKKRETFALVARGLQQAAAGELHDSPKGFTRT